MAKAQLLKAPKSTSPSTLVFPAKLHLLLEDSDKKYQDIISWLPDGRAFKVHDKERFANQIMPTYFGSNKYRTFQKSLNMWGFQAGRKGECSHPLFLRGSEELAQTMKRKTVKKGTSQTTSSSVATATANALTGQIMHRPLSTQRRLFEDPGLAPVNDSTIMAATQALLSTPTDTNTLAALNLLTLDSLRPHIQSQVLPSATYHSPIVIGDPKHLGGVPAPVAPATSTSHRLPVQLLAHDDPLKANNLSELRALTKIAILAELQKLDTAILTAAALPMR